MDKGAAKAEGGTPAPRGVPAARPSLCIDNASPNRNVFNWRLNALWSVKS